MISIFLWLVCAFVMYVSAANGSWGTFWVFTVGLVFVIVCAIGTHLDNKAWIHRRNYWAMSGKDRAKARRRWEREADEEEAREKEKNIERARRKRGETVLVESNRTNPYRCIVCGTDYEEAGRRKYQNGAVMIDCLCPSCGNRKLMKLENGMEEYPMRATAWNRPVNTYVNGTERGRHAERSKMTDLFETRNPVGGPYDTKK